MAKSVSNSLKGPAGHSVAGETEIEIEISETSGLHLVSQNRKK